MQSSEDSTPTSPQQLESKPSANDKRVVIIGIMGDALKSSTEGLGLVEELNKQCLVCMNYLMTNIASSTGSRLGNQLNEQSGQQQTETQNLELKYLLYIYVNIDRLLERNKSNINNDNASDLAKFFLYCTENIEKHAKFNSVYGTNINKLIYYLKIVSMYLNYQEHSFHGQLLNFNEKDIIFHAQLIYKVCVRFLTNYSSNLKLVAVTLVALSQCAKFLNSVDDFNTVFRIFCTYLDYKTKEMLSASQQEQVSSNNNTSPRIQRDLFDSLVKSTTNVIVCRNASRDQKRKLFFSVMNTGLVLFNSLKLLEFDVNPNIRHSISIIDQILRYCSSIYLFVSQALEKSKQPNCEENKTLISEFIIEYAKLKIDEKEETEQFTLLTALVSWILHEKPMQDILKPLLDIVWKILDTIFTRPKRSIFSTMYCLISVQIAIYMDTYEKRDDYVEFVLNNILRVNIFLMPELMDALNKKLDLSDLKLIFSEYQKSTLYSYMYLVVNNLVTIPQTNPSRYIDFMYDFSKELSDTFSQAFSKNRPSKGLSLIDELVSMEDLKFHLKNISSLLLVFILKIYSNNSKLMNTSQSLAQIEKNEKISSENVIQIIKIFANTEFMKDLDSVSLYIQFMSKIIQYHHHTISDFISSSIIFSTLNTQLTTSSGNMVLLSIIYFYLNFFSSLVKSKQYHEDLFKPHVIPFMFKCLLNSNKQIVQQAHHLLITFFTENYNVRNLILPHYLRVVCDKKYSNTNSHLQSLFCNSFHFIFNHIKDSRLIEHSLNQIEQLIIHSNQASQKHLTKQLILLLFQSSQTIEYSHLPMLFSLLKRVLLSDKQLPLSSLLRDFYHIVNSCIDYVRRDDCVQFYLELSKDMM